MLEVEIICIYCRWNLNFPSGGILALQALLKVASKWDQIMHFKIHWDRTTTCSLEDGSHESDGGC